jgi:hypothetical protein
MKFSCKVFLASILVCFVFNLNSQAQDKPESKTSWGSKIVLKDALTLTEAIKNFKTIGNKEILVEGAVQKVCEEKGCWMGIGDGNLKVRVTFKNYGFFVPTDLVGKKAMIQGVLEHTTMSVADARHYAKDSGAGANEVAAITKPVEEFRLVASGVELKRN